MTDEKAPGAAGTAADGEDPNPTRGTIMPIVNDADEIREGRAAAARPRTVAVDPSIDIRDTPDLRSTTIKREKNEPPVPVRIAKLAEDELAGAPLHILRTKMATRVLVWRSADGTWWRRGGAVRIQRWPDTDGPRAFVVTLHEGASRSDLEHLLHAVERARTGRGLETEWERVTAPGVDDMTYRLAFSSWKYDDPYTHGDLSPKVDVCDEPACMHKWHDEFGEHLVDTVEQRLRDGDGRYVVSVYRALDDEVWKVSVYTDEFYGTPDDVATLVNDLQWMATECRRANSKAVAA